MNPRPVIGPGQRLHLLGGAPAGLSEFGGRKPGLSCFKVWHRLELISRHTQTALSRLPYRALGLLSTLQRPSSKWRSPADLPWLGFQKSPRHSEAAQPHSGIFRTTRLHRRPEPAAQDNLQARNRNKVRCCASATANTAVCQLRIFLSDPLIPAEQLSTRRRCPGDHRRQVVCGRSGGHIIANHAWQRRRFFSERKEVREKFEG